jgi:hypothetical protein
MAAAPLRSRYRAGHAPVSFVLACDDRRWALRHFGTGSCRVVAEALGHHELAVAAHVDNATVGESYDDRERSWAILSRCASPRSQRLVAGCAAFHPAPVTTHHAQPEPYQRAE